MGTNLRKFISSKLAKSNLLFQFVLIHFIFKMLTEHCECLRGSAGMYVAHITFSFAQMGKRPQK